MSSEFLDSIMGKLVRVTLTDTRTVEGLLQCVDYLGNLIIYDAHVGSGSATQRMSSCMVGSEHIQKVETDLAIISGELDNK